MSPAEELVLDIEMWIGEYFKEDKNEQEAKDLLKSIKKHIEKVIK